MNESVSLVGALFFFGFTFLIFLLLREVWCWYWKINKVVSLQMETNELLRTLVKNQRGDKQDQTADYDKYEL